MTVLHKSFKVLQSFYAVDYQLRPSVEVISSCPKMRGNFQSQTGDRAEKLIAKKRIGCPCQRLWVRIGEKLEAPSNNFVPSMKLTWFHGDGSRGEFSRFMNLD
jgi:hypothetical protein